MELMLIGASALLAVVAYFVRPLRLVMGCIAMTTLGFGSGMMFAKSPSILSFIALCFGIAQICNYARLVMQRLHAKHLRKAFFIGGARLLALQVSFYIADWYVNGSENITSYASSLLIALQLIVAWYVLAMTIGRLYASRPKDVSNHYTDKDLPSISVLIPARNEDDDLVALLRSVVANDYPKLEILVLDDCSTSKRIPEIVKQFAHAGVRFVQGDEPRENWLAKNQAYHTLASNASGDWLMFMGVDVRLGVGSLRALVHYALNHNRLMLSVMPHRYGGTFWAGFFTPLRYFKEMLKVGVWKFNAPALSTLWLINKNDFLSLGGMPSVAGKVIPEHYFANQLNKRRSYAFVRTNDYLQVSTAKSLREQLATSLRTLYPGLHRRLEWTAVVTLGLGFLLFAPYAGLVQALVNGQTELQIIYGVIVVMLSTAHLLVTTCTNPILWPLALVNFPYLVLQEIALYVVSMYKYEFGEVVWKERNICIPVLQAIPRLPNLDN